MEKDLEIDHVTKEDLEKLAKTKPKKKKKKEKVIEKEPKKRNQSSFDFKFFDTIKDTVPIDKEKVKESKGKDLDIFLANISNKDLIHSWNERENYDDDMKEKIIDNLTERKLMKKACILLTILLLAGCATPASVKFAVKKQSEAYTELQGALRDFNRLYVQLNERLFRLNQESRARIEALSMVRALSGLELDPEVRKLNPHAEVKSQQVKEIAMNLDRIPPSRAELLTEINRSIRLLEEAFRHGQIESKKSNKKIRESLVRVNDSHTNVSKEIRALMVIHDAVGEYLGIDLTPESKVLKEAITNIQALEK